MSRVIISAAIAAAFIIWVYFGVPMHDGAVRLD